METPKQLAERLSVWEREVSVREQEVTPLIKNVEYAQTKVQERTEELAKAQSELEEAQSAWAAECRRFASGGGSDVEKFKARVTKAEAKVEGLKALLADDEKAAAAASAELAGPEERLAEARNNEAETSAMLRVSEAVQRVEEKFESLRSEADAAMDEFSYMDNFPALRTAANIQRARMFRLREGLRGVAARF